MSTKVKTKMLNYFCNNDCKWYVNWFSQATTQEEDIIENCFL